METADILIYSASIPSRLQFITDFIGNSLFGGPFKLTKTIEEYNSHAGPKINYSDTALGKDEFRIKPHTLIFEKGFLQQEINCFVTSGVKAFFNTEGDLNFDIFAAGFYLLSRYEEYLPHQKDNYGRYSHENSVAFRENFLDQPLVNQWIHLFRKKLAEKFPGLKFREPQTTFLPTYDIDEAWSYKSKSAIRTMGGIAKAILKGEWDRVLERRRVLSGNIPDPYDAFGWMDEVNSRFRLQPIYFFLVPSAIGKFDRNILPAEKHFQELVRVHSKKYRVGVHPSWQSGDDSLLVKSEIQTLESLTGKHIECSRQHFIRFTLPGTYRILSEAGITSDYSMGYGSINGFRASVASPFYWYDLEKECTTKLLIYPFCFMEANSYFEQKQTAEQTLEELTNYYKVVNKVNGLFISIWHNTFLGTEKRFKGWREVYEQFLASI
jgi:hypothetical protein